MNKDAGQDQAGDKGDLEERKAKLMRQGEFHRISILHAKEQIKHAARPQVMLHDALDYATYAIRGRIDGLLHPTRLSVSSVAPYALSILGLIRRRHMGKQALGVSVALAALGWYLQRRRERQLVH